MKTLREVLLQHHQSAEPKLDRLRAKSLQTLRQTQGTLTSKSATPLNFSWRELLLSFRWHLAGISAVWCVIAILNNDHSPAPAPGLAHEKLPSPQEILTALRENRRQILELIEAPLPEPIALPPAFVPPRRTKLESTNSMA